MNLPRGVWTSFSVFAALTLMSCDYAKKGTQALPKDHPVEVREPIDDGRAIAETLCAWCHAIGESDASPNPRAPPLRLILRQYDPSELKEGLAGGERISHPMPDFQLDPQDADALIAYIRSVQEPRSD